MKTPASRHLPVAAPSPAEPQSKRRQLVVGAGIAAGAAIAASAALRHQAEAPAGVARAEADAQGGEGYRLTDHVLRYYETTRT